MLESTYRCRGEPHDLDTLRSNTSVSGPFILKISAKAPRLTFNQVPIEQAAPYAAEDAEVTLRLPAVGKAQSGALAVRSIELEMPLVPCSRALNEMAHWLQTRFGPQPGVRRADSVAGG